MSLGHNHGRGAGSAGVGLARLALLALAACRGGGNTNESMESAFDLQPFTLLAFAGGTAEEFSAAVAPLDKAGIRHVDQWGRGEIEIWVPTCDLARAKEILERAGPRGAHLRLADAPDTRRGDAIHGDTIRSDTMPSATRP